MAILSSSRLKTVALTMVALAVASRVPAVSRVVLNRG